MCGPNLIPRSSWERAWWYGKPLNRPYTFHRCQATLLLLYWTAWPPWRCCGLGRSISWPCLTLTAKVRCHGDQVTMGSVNNLHCFVERVIWLKQERYHAPPQPPSGIRPTPISSSALPRPPFALRLPVRLFTSCLSAPSCPSVQYATFSLRLPPSHLHPSNLTVLSGSSLWFWWICRQGFWLALWPLSSVDPSPSPARRLGTRPRLNLNSRYRNSLSVPFDWRRRVASGFCFCFAATVNAFAFLENGL